MGRLISSGGPITVDEFRGEDRGLLGKGRALARKRGSRTPRYWVFAALLLSFWLQIDAAAAGGPAAIVEETDAPSLRLQAMDYVVEGQRIALQPGEAIILGYLASCQRERITGGEIVVGAAESQVVGGDVKRNRVECDGGAMDIAADQAAKSAVMVFRVPPPPATDANGHRLPAAQVTLFSLYPVIDAGPATGAVIVDRLDRSAQAVHLAVEGRSIDLATRHLKLAAGGLYRASIGERTIVFQISQGARSSGGPVLGRLLRL